LITVALVRSGGVAAAVLDLPVTWFSVIAVCVSLLSLLSTQLVRHRTDRRGPSSVAGTLLACTLVTGAAVVVLGAVRVFPLAVAAYLVVAMVRPLFSPLMSGWMIARIEPGVRATALSAVDLFDSGGQIVGGPVVGVIGTLTSIRVALMAGAAALAPAAVAVAGAAARRSEINGHRSQHGHRPQHGPHW
jgi:MFS transporter, DHA3 family, tetracycline resistance protein